MLMPSAMEKGSIVSIAPVPEPCPFCEADDVVLLRTEGINNRIFVCYCRACEREWPEAFPPPTVN